MLTTPDGYMGFQKKVQALSHANGFALSTAATQVLENLKKKDIVDSVIQSVDPKSPFTMETDASDHAIAANLTQNDQPVAFFSRTLTHSEQKHPSVGKEAHAIVEAL